MARRRHTPEQIIASSGRARRGRTACGLSCGLALRCSAATSFSSTAAVEGSCSYLRRMARLVSGARRLRALR
jgi:hypothetical protein